MDAAGPVLPCRQGEKPLHEYLREQARRQPDKPAFIRYGRALSWREFDVLSEVLRRLLK